jgi:hypothetical protein
LGATATFLVVFVLYLPALVTLTVGAIIGAVAGTARETVTALQQRPLK